MIKTYQHAVSSALCSSTQLYAMLNNETFSGKAFHVGIRARCVFALPSTAPAHCFPAPLFPSTPGRCIAGPRHAAQPYALCQQRLLLHGRDGASIPGGTQGGARRAAQSTSFCAAFCRALAPLSSPLPRISLTNTNLLQGKYASSETDSELVAYESPDSSDEELSDTASSAAALAHDRDHGHDDYDMSDPVHVQETALSSADGEPLGLRASVLEQEEFTKAHQDLIERLARCVSGCGCGVGADARKEGWLTARVVCHLPVQLGAEHRG